VFIDFVVYFIIDSVREFVDTPSYGLEKDEATVNDKRKVVRVLQ